MVLEVREPAAGRERAHQCMRDHGPGVLLLHIISVLYVDRLGVQMAMFRPSESYGGQMRVCRPILELYLGARGPRLARCVLCVLYM